ncbi:hypothetical protein llap_19448 [Limosa lapponica baueri]|uniref:Uncharacterized protein n=1 Tax=Limosa lapponica baueri TaxID=1758121 RepID=A0A2I0T8Y1_LIMLA|nr:hypothetical protein llap_19448 [Limosa lapponica baueri]
MLDESSSPNVSFCPTFSCHITILAASTGLAVVAQAGEALEVIWSKPPAHTGFRGAVLDEEGEEGGSLLLRLDVGNWDEGRAVDIFLAASGFGFQQLVCDKRVVSKD